MMTENGVESLVPEANAVAGFYTFESIVELLPGSRLNSK